MSGINSLSGLNKVNVDFRPTIEPDVPKTANANQPQSVEVINLDDEQQPPARNAAKTVVRELDVLLLNAAGRSVATDTVKNVNAVGKELVNTGVISEKDLAKLENLVKDAADKLKALVKFSGREIAKAFGCEDVVVKYSVGSHDGKFGIFMEKAKGVAGEDFTKKGADGGGGIPPTEMHKITDQAEQTKIKGTIAQQLNKLMWLDLITGQGDRHWGNYFIHIDKTTHEVTVKGIDNDASFSATRIGLLKFALDKDKTALYEAQLKDVCQKIHGKGWQAEYDRRVKNDPAIVRNGNTMTIDLTKAKSHEVRMAIIHTLGLQSIALPEEIDKEFYDKLMEMDEDPAKKQAYLDSIAPRISPDALKATEARLNEAIAHAKTLNVRGKVYRKPQWQNEDNLKGMTSFKSNVTIKKSDGSTIKPDGNDIECVRDYNERKCPSFFKREFHHRMFEKPA